jgi:hypothetical protein
MFLADDDEHAHLETDSVRGPSPRNTSTLAPLNNEFLLRHHGNSLGSRDGGNSRAVACSGTTVANTDKSERIGRYAEWKEATPATFTLPQFYLPAECKARSVGMGLARGHEIWAALNAIHVERAI